MMPFLPRVVSWNVTTACNLRCPHCYLDGGRRASGELTTEEGIRLLDELAAAGTELLTLSGGEPLLRSDLPFLAAHAAGKGIAVVLGTNGTLINHRRARMLKEHGVMAAGISIDSLDPTRHDAFRGVGGSWQRALQAIEACRAAGLDVLLHTTALRSNLEEIPDILSFAASKGARGFQLFFLVCTGRGEKLTDVSPQEYEGLLCCLLDAQQRYPDMLIRARCAPYVRRLAIERGSSLAASSGCLAGTSYCRITPTGEVTPCPYLPITIGDVRADRFQQVWDSSPFLNQLRSPQLQGKCGECSLAQGQDPICVGCRARAFASTGDVMGADPWCLYQPAPLDRPGVADSACPASKGEPSRSRTGRASSRPVTWSADAQERLERIPAFIRGRVKQAAEAHARAQGLQEVTLPVLEHLKRRAIGGR